jgi:hypothetical protein
MFEGNKCECGRAYGGFPEKKHFNLSRATDNIASHGLSEIERWRRIVTLFSSKSLTYERDNLLALSGVAKAFKLGRYLAGCWEVYILEDLLWNRPRKNRPTKRYIAPSWSWASASGPVHFYKPSNWVPWSTFVDAEVVNVNNDPTGRVISGSITLRGPCFMGDDCVRLQLGCGRYWTDSIFEMYSLMLWQVQVDPARYARVRIDIRPYVYEVDEEDSWKREGIFTII